MAGEDAGSAMHYRGVVTFLEGSGQHPSRYKHTDPKAQQLPPQESVISI